MIACDDADDFQSLQKKPVSLKLTKTWTRTRGVGPAKWAACAEWLRRHVRIHRPQSREETAACSKPLAHHRMNVSASVSALSLSQQLFPTELLRRFAAMVEIEIVMNCRFAVAAAKEKTYPTDR